jgi:hypothetical protein
VRSSTTGYLTRVLVSGLADPGGQKPPTRGVRLTSSEGWLLLETFEIGVASGEGVPRGGKRSMLRLRNLPRKRPRIPSIMLSPNFLTSNQSQRTIFSYSG